jgi:hypothetical protein
VRRKDNLARQGKEQSEQPALEVGVKVDVGLVENNRIDALQPKNVEQELNENLDTVAGPHDLLRCPPFPIIEVYLRTSRVHSDSGLINGDLWQPFFTEVEEFQ